MITKRVTRYYADCGRAWWTKKACLTHEKNCKCWTNPKHRTCKTCRFATKDSESIEDGHGQVIKTESWFDCTNPSQADKEHSGAPEGHDYISVNCIGWEGK